ncbi:hypothetical protein EI555_010224, partial [Monodon monoceros]
MVVQAVSTSWAHPLCNSPSKRRSHLCFCEVGNTETPPKEGSLLLLHYPRLPQMFLPVGLIRLRAELSLSFSESDQVVLLTPLHSVDHRNYGNVLPSEKLTYQFSTRYQSLWLSERECLTGSHYHVLNRGCGETQLGWHGETYCLVGGYRAYGAVSLATPAKVEAEKPVPRRAPKRECALEESGEDLRCTRPKIQRLQHSSSLEIQGALILKQGGPTSGHIPSATA